MSNLVSGTMELHIDPAEPGGDKTILVIGGYRGRGFLQFTGMVKYEEMLMPSAAPSLKHRNNNRDGLRDRWGRLK